MKKAKVGLDIVDITSPQRLAARIERLNVAIENAKRKNNPVRVESLTKERDEKRVILVDVIRDLKKSIEVKHGD